MNHCTHIIVICDTARWGAIINVWHSCSCSGGVCCHEFVLCMEQQLTIFMTLWKSASINTQICNITLFFHLRQLCNCIVKLFFKLVVQDRRVPRRICCDEHVRAFIHFGIHRDEWQSIMHVNRDGTSLQCNNTLLSSCSTQLIVNDQTKVFHLSLKVNGLSNSKVCAL